MSLTDVDKHNFDRGVPQPNHSDVIIDGALKSHKTISSHYKTDADTTAGRLQMGNKQIVANDGTNPRALYGYNNALNDWGLYVTKPGFDVTTSTTLSNFIFNSSQNVFKIAVASTITFSKGASSNSASTQIVHGLGVAPLVIAWFLSGGFYIPFGQTGAAITGANSGKVTEATSISADATNVYFQVIAPDWAGNGNYTAAETYVVRYYLLQETAS